jgi:hypothetical protein
MGWSLWVTDQSQSYLFTGPFGEPCIICIFTSANSVSCYLKAILCTNYCVHTSHYTAAGRDALNNFESQLAPTLLKHQERGATWSDMASAQNLPKSTWLVHQFTWQTIVSYVWLTVNTKLSMKTWRFEIHQKISGTSYDWSEENSGEKPYFKV